MHNESPLPIGRVEPCSTDSAFAPGRVEPCSTEEKQPTSGRLYQSGSVELQRQRAKRTAMWVGGVAVLVYVGFILSGVIGR